MAVEKSQEFADKVAQLCYKQFEKLPKKGKPQLDREWTILAAILLHNKNKDDLQIISLATGSKCLGRNLLSSNGDLVNDSHAEVLARRGLLRYLHHQLGTENSIFSQEPITKKFHLKKEFSFIFFSSHTPCGDSSIIPKSADSSAVDDEDLGCEAPPHKIPRLDEKDVHRTGAKCAQGGPQDPKLSGMDHHITGVLRTKPGRGDPTLSMSCSDKLAKWNILGIQGSLLMNLLAEPIYLSEVVIGKCPYSQEAMERALIHRFPDIESLHPLFKQQKELVIYQSQHEFQFCKPIQDQGLQPCPSSIIWTACPSKPLEVSVEGAKQGVTKKNRGKPSCRLEICKKNLFQSFVSLVKKVESKPPHLGKIEELPYHQAKQLAVDYFQSWQTIRENVMTNWTSKPSSHAEFTVKD